MSRLQFTTGAGPWTYPPDAPHALAAPAMSPSAREGVVARRSTKDSSKGSLPDPRNAAQRGSAKSAPHEARNYAARLIRAVAAPEALGHHCFLLCNCQDELPNFARELAGEANAKAGGRWKRAQEGEHRTWRAATLVRPAIVLSVHLPSFDLVIGRDLRSASVGLAAAGNGNSVVPITVTNRFHVAGPRHR